MLARLVLPGEDAYLPEQVLRRDPEWVAPALVHSELRNVLATWIRLGRITREEGNGAASRAERLMDGREVAVSTPEVLELAERSGCTAYDCEFVAVARELDAMLVTSDRQVLSAFPETAVSPEAFVSH